MLYKPTQVCAVVSFGLVTVTVDMFTAHTSYFGDFVIWLFCAGAQF